MPQRESNKRIHVLNVFGARGAGLTSSLSSRRLIDEQTAFRHNSFARL